MIREWEAHLGEGVALVRGLLEPLLQHGRPRLHHEQLTVLCLHLYVLLRQGALELEGRGGASHLARGRHVAELVELAVVLWQILTFKTRTHTETQSRRLTTEARGSNLS